MLEFIFHKNFVDAMSVLPSSLATGLDRLYTKPSQICVIFHFIKESILFKLFLGIIKNNFILLKALISPIFISPVCSKSLLQRRKSP